MLPIESLDKEKFSEIVERAKEKIEEIYPAWTNYNPADSGMALLELLSHMFEMQQFHLDQIGTSHQLAYLHLLGIKPLGVKPASVLGKIEQVEQEYYLPKGSKVLAGSIIFETMETTYIEAPYILPHKQESFFYPFGETPQKGDVYELCLQHRLKKDVAHTLYFQLEENDAVKRNPVDSQNFIPLVYIKLQFFHGNQYIDCEILEDNTYQLLQSGSIKFTMPEEMEQDINSYKLRLVLEDGEYDVPPFIKGISFNIISLEQKNTLYGYEDFKLSMEQKECYKAASQRDQVLYGHAEIYINREGAYSKTKEFTSFIQEDKRVFVFPKEVFPNSQKEIAIRIVYNQEENKEDVHFVGNGMPNQEFHLLYKNIIKEEFALWVEEENNTEKYIPWTCVEDFGQSGIMDRHFVIKGDVLKFGDGRQGRMPEGKIAIIAYKTSQGRDGNIQRNQLSAFESNRYKGTITNMFPASGGENSEAIEEGFLRINHQIKEIKRAVQYTDYEELVKQTPGLLIKQVMACPSFERENEIVIVVQPLIKGKKQILYSRYEQNIRRYIEKRKMLGTEIAIQFPEYVAFHLRLEVMIKSRYAQAKNIIEDKIRQYFETNMKFGNAVIYSRVYGYIDMLEEITGICDLSIYAKGKGVVRNENKDIYLPMNGLAYLEELQVQCILDDK